MYSCRSNHFFRGLLWSAIALVSMALSGCLDIKGDLQIHSSGAADVTLQIDASKMAAVASSFAKSSNDGTDKPFNCESFLTKERKNVWSCEVLSAEVISAKRHFSAIEARPFLSVEGSPWSQKFLFNPARFNNQVHAIGDVDPVQHVQELQQMKLFGLTMLLDVQFPVNIMRIGDVAPTEEQLRLTIDLMDPAIYQEGYRIEAQGVNRSVWLAFALSVLLIGAGGYVFIRQKRLSAKVRVAIVSVCFVSAGLLASSPWWGTTTSELKHSVEASAASAITPLTPVAHLAALSAPNPTIAFETLYGVTPNSNNEANLPDGQVAKLHYATEVKVGDVKHYLLLVQRSQPDDTSYAAGVEVDAVSLREENNQWVIDATQPMLFSAGSYGAAAALFDQNIEQHALGQNTIGLFIPESDSHQGYSFSYFKVIAVAAGRIEMRGRIDTGENNEGTCDSSAPVELSTCYSWAGEVSIQLQDDNQAATIFLRKRGSESLNGSIITARNIMYQLDENNRYHPVILNE